MTDQPSAPTRVAFVGLGTMGLPLARNLLVAGYEVTGYDVDPGRAAELGRPLAASPADAARDADVVITSLPSPSIVETVAFGPDGILEGINPGATLIEMSTSPPSLARQLTARFGEIGVGVLDAPVSGGPRGATDASLTIMVGGPAELFERWRPLLSSLGRLVVRVGDTGAGQVAKLCNNLISGVTMVAISESCAIAAREGVDPALLYELLRNSLGDSRVLRTRFPIAGADPAHPSSNEYLPLFMLDLIVKDLKLAIDLSDSLGLPASLTRRAVERYEQAQAAGHGRLDYSAVYLVIGGAPGTDCPALDPGSAA